MSIGETSIAIAIYPLPVSGKLRRAGGVVWCLVENEGMAKVAKGQTEWVGEMVKISNILL